MGTGQPSAAGLVTKTGPPAWETGPILIPPGGRMELAELSGFFSLGLAQPVGYAGSWATCIHGPRGEALGGPREAQS